MPPKNEQATEEQSITPEQVAADTAETGQDPAPETPIEEAAVEDLVEEEPTFPKEAIPDLPAESRAVLEKAYPVLQEHGSYNAAAKGLQTDASGQYTHPSQL